MQALQNIMSDLGLSSEKHTENGESSNAPAASSTSGTAHHDKTAAEEVKEKAVSSESDLDRKDSQPITTNPEQAHAQPKPALLSRDTAGSTFTDGADDNASMIPLGKGRPSEPFNESSIGGTPTRGSAPSTIAEDDAPISNPGAKGHTRSTSVQIAPSRSEIDAAKSAIIMAVASCPVNREVSFSTEDNGTDTGRLEVRQILKGYKGIDAAIQEMNRDVKITLLNATPMSSSKAKETLGLRDNDEGNASFAKTGSITPSHEGTSASPLSTQPIGGSEPTANAKTSPGLESVLSQKTALATAPTTSATEPSSRNTERRSSTIMPTSPGKPGLDRLNTLQKEELAKVPSAEENRAVQGTDHHVPKTTGSPVTRKPVPLVEEVPRSTSSEPVGSDVAPAGGARVSRSDSLAKRLRAEIDERARATREGRPAPATSTASTSDATPSTSNEGTSGSAPITDKAAGAVAALPLIEEREKEKEIKEQDEAAPAPTVLTDLTPEPLATGPESAVSATTETSKPSAFTEEFEKPENSSTAAVVNATAVGTTSETPAASTSTPVVPSTTTKDSPKLSYADANGGKRQSKDAKSGGFLSGLFRRRSSYKPDSSNKANGVQSKTVSEPVKTVPVVEKEEEKAVLATAPVVEETPLEKTQTKGSVIEKDTTPEEAREMAEAAVAGDNPVIENEVANADAKDAPATTTTEDGGKAASILEDLEHGPKETVGEPGTTTALSTRSRSSSVTADYVKRTPVEREASTAEEPAIAVGTSEPLAEQETRQSEDVTPATTAAPATTTSPVRSPTQQKKKNRFSALFSRSSKKDKQTSKYVYREVGSPKHSTNNLNKTITRDTTAEPEVADAEADESAAVDEGDVTGVTAASKHTHSRPATLDERVDTEPEDEVEPEPVVPDNRSITEIAATTPLPEPAYTEKTKAKHEKLRKQREYEEMVRKEKARREAELLYKRDRIMNAYTGKQDFSKVPKSSRTKNFGKSIHTGSNKEGVDPIQHIVKSDKKALKAEEAAEPNSRGSSIHEERQAAEDSHDPHMVSLFHAMHKSTSAEKPDANTGDQSVGEILVVPEPEKPAHGYETADVVVHDASAADASASPASTGVKKRKSVKKTSISKPRKSAEAGLSPLTAVTAPTASEPTSPTSPATPSSPKSPSTDLKKRASTKSNKSTRGTSAVTPVEKPVETQPKTESNILPEIPTKQHRRVRSGDSAITGEDHALHLTGNTADTGLIRKASTKSNRTSGGTSRRKSSSVSKSTPIV